MRKTFLMALLGLGLVLPVVASAATTGAALVSIGAGLKGPQGLRATVYATGLQHVSALRSTPADGSGSRRPPPPATAPMGST